MQSVPTSPTSPPGGGRGVGIGVAAGRVGVAAATLRAWERRYGLQPSSVTPGGHRRYSPADLSALKRVKDLIESGMPTARAATLSHTGSAPASAPVVGSPQQRRRPASAPARTDSVLDHYEQWSAAAQDLAAPDLARVARAILARRGAAAAWSDVFAPYLQAVGRNWAATGGGTEFEHVTVAVLQTVLRRYALRGQRRSGHSAVLLAATPGEHHTLPLDALAAALADASISSCVVYDLPAPSLHDTQRRLAADVVVLWARSAGTADVPLLHSFTDRVSKLYAAGPGWRPGQLPDGVVHVADLESGVTALHGERVREGVSTSRSRS